MLIDSHCHLNFPEYKNILPEVINRAMMHNVKFMQTICTKIEEFPILLEITEQFDNVYCSVGVHPNSVTLETIAQKEDLLKLSLPKKVIGLGETGLDYYRDSSDKDLQKKSFIAHINAAQENNLPVIVHTRDADNDTIDILSSLMKEKEFKGLIHCFTSSKELAYKAIDLGLYISISGIITFKNATSLQEIVKDLPLDKLLVETDAPFLAPIPFRGKTNEPAYTKYTAEFIAQLKNIPYQEVAKKTTENFCSLFNLKALLG